MKFVDIVRTAIGNSFRSKLRTTLTVIAIFIGAFTLTITSAIGAGVSSYINTQVASIGAANVLTVTKTAAATKPDAGPAKYDPSKVSGSGGFGGGAAAAGISVATLDSSDVKTIAAIPGILDVNPLVQVSPDYVQSATSGKYQVTVNQTAAFTKADLAAGSQLDSGGGTNQVLLPISYLGSLGFATANDAIGHTLTFGVTDYLGTQHQVTATVAGVQNTTLIGGGLGFNQHLTDALHTVQTTGRPAAKTTGYAVATAHIASNATTAQIDAIKKDLHAKGFTAQTVADQIGSFETVINGIIGVLDAFAIIALVAAGFGIINTLLMSVQERTREIGLMKAMGMSGSKVYALFSTEAVFIGFLGSAIGAAVAIGLGSLVSSALSRTVLSGLPGLHVMLFTPGSIAVIIGVVMVIAFLAGTLPARRAARQNPIDALRYE
ncbi:ABC transporter permease [Rathayibacter soli]|uniref:ABC transporter permease n=1 Tax=Rathayibacter soli TaxID=3144168 RepID=UPI0027E59BD5|nr:FtsX-like permease family protein [Glaciibacter superstes]